jgi:putative ABC transport system substrate-binding protein
VILLSALVLFAPSFETHAQTSPVVKIGWLTTARHPFIESFREGLRELGYVEGKNLVIEERHGSPERLPELADELLRLKVDVLVASAAAAARVATRVSASIPVVFVTGQAVTDGIVASLARPGGNATGISLMNPEMSQKWVELLKVMFPRISRMAILWDSGTSRLQLEAIETAVRNLHLQPQVLEVHSPDGLDAAFEGAVRARAEVLVVGASPLLAANKQRVVSLAARHRLPAMYEHRDFVEAGGLMSYGADLREVFRRAASYVHRILGGPTLPSCLWSSRARSSSC